MNHSSIILNLRVSDTVNLKHSLYYTAKNYNLKFTILWKIENDNIMGYEGLLSHLKTKQYENYSKLLWLFKPKNQVIRHDTFLKSIIFLSDSASPLVSKTALNIQDLDYELLNQSLFRPDLARSDFHLFYSLKDKLERIHFCLHEDVTQVMQNWLLHTKLKIFFHDRIQKFIKIWIKCKKAEGIVRKLFSYFLKCK